MTNTQSQLSGFTEHLGGRYQVEFDNYQDLHQWCCEHPAEFWGTWIEHCGLAVEGCADTVLAGNDFLSREFFPQTALNYARCLLQGSDASADGDSAVTLVNESGEQQTITRGELRKKSLCFAAGLMKLGVKPGDCIVAVARNSIDSIVACLGSIAIGAVWSSVSPELGVTAIVERFKQLSPTLILANTRYTVNGAEKSIATNLSEVTGSIESVETLIILAEDDPIPELPCQILSFAELLSNDGLSLEALEDFPFDHPLFVMYSSGTTGVPKCIVHGAGGTLLEHLKEHRLHGDLCAEDTLMFQTSTGWMMWNWQLSALASGTHIVLYDGSVSYPGKDRLLKVIDEHAVTVFGTSPAYIQFLIESGIEPRSHYEFAPLRAIQSTGSVRYDTQFDWIAKYFKDVPVQSVSGGTDMIGCLVLGHPDLPVQSGDSQCISLGIDVRVLTDTGIEQHGTGELVVVKPFPSQPVFFWNDRDQQKLNASYFDKNPGVWTHGDQIRIDERGSPRILGRSDGTLNVRGVRIGPAEILSIVNQTSGVRESMVVEQASPREPGGSRLVLLLVTHSENPLDRTFVLQLKKQLATRASRLHVPAVVVKVPALPRTHNGKLSEKAARDAVNGVKAANVSALANPEILNLITAAVPTAPQ